MCNFADGTRPFSDRTVKLYSNYFTNHSKSMCCFMHSYSSPILRIGPLLPCGFALHSIIPGPGLEGGATLWVWYRVSLPHHENDQLCSGTVDPRVCD